MTQDSILIGGNWKLNPTTISEAEKMTQEIVFPEKDDNLEVALFPPLIFLEDLSTKFTEIGWGAQDFFFEDSGAYTGEVSLPMLKDVGVNHVLVGHSDRRLKFGETDEVVNQKLLAALEEGFNAILAVGEPEKSENSTQLIVESLKKSTQGVTKDHLSRLSVAYEPVWAISTSGSGETASPEYASSVILELKKELDVRYLYGGSVNAENAKSFLSSPNIWGALVGGASLKPDNFSKILEVASKE